MRASCCLAGQMLCDASKRHVRFHADGTLLGNMQMTYLWSLSSSSGSHHPQRRPRTWLGCLHEMAPQTSHGVQERQHREGIWSPGQVRPHEPTTCVSHSCNEMERPAAEQSTGQCRCVVHDAPSPV